MQPGDKLFEALLQIELTNGNDGRQKNWYQPAQTRKRFERILRKMGLEREPFDCPVIVRVTRILGKRQREWDTDSGLRGSYKELQDSLVAVGWFHDDCPKYIKDVQFRQDINHRTEGPAVRLEVFSVE